MKKYAAEYKHGKCIITEFSWGITKDANRKYAHKYIEEANREVEEMNNLMSYYEKQLAYQI